MKLAHLLICATAASAFVAVPHHQLSTSPRRPTVSMPAVIPGNSVAEAVVLGGTANFFNIYNIVLTARILLSWFPQAQSIGALQPLFIVTEPFLALFRGLIPPLFGIDFSLLPALFLLQAAGNTVLALGADPSLLQ